jgi:hypothetical protein
MPLFIASSSSLQQAQQFTWIRDNGVACPILEFILPKGQICDSVACVESLSHFPDEKEWLMSAYTPFKYCSQRLEYLEIGRQSILKLVVIVQYTVLPHEETFATYEAKGQDIKTVMLLCKPMTFLSETKGENAFDIEKGALDHYETQKQYHSAAALEMSRQLEEDRLLRLEPAELYKNRITDAQIRREIHRLVGIDDELGFDEDYCPGSDSKEPTLSQETTDELKRLLAATEEQVRQEEAVLLIHQKELHEVTVKNEETQTEIADIRCELHSVQEKITTLNEAICAKRSEQEACEDEKGTVDATRTQCLWEIDLEEKEILALKVERKTTLDDIARYTKNMEPLLEEERAAYARWEARERAKEVSTGAATLSWEEKLLCVERAKQQFIDSVFPPEEMQALKDKVKQQEDKSEMLTEHIRELNQKTVELSERSTTLAESIESCLLTISELDIEKSKEQASADIIKTKLQTAEHEGSCYMEEIHKHKTAITGHPERVQELWNALANNVVAVICEANGISKSFMEIRSSLSS